MKKSTIAAASILGAGLLFAVAAPLAASAHVTIADNTADAGDYTLLTIKVPNESATAATTSVVLHLPTDTPFDSVSYVPTPGWTTTVTADAVTWTGGEITDGQLQLFQVSVGPVPDVDSVTLPVTQTYDDGTVAEWNGEGDEPAPVLYVNAEPEADHHAEAEEVETETDDSDGDTLARVLGIGGLVVGAVGIVLAVTARRRSA
jgi:uncharacterized protein YcnI